MQDQINEIKDTVEKLQIELSELKNFVNASLNKEADHFLNIIDRKLKEKYDKTLSDI